MAPQLVGRNSFSIGEPQAAPVTPVRDRSVEARRLSADASPPTLAPIPGSSLGKAKGLAAPASANPSSFLVAGARNHRYRLASTSGRTSFDPVPPARPIMEGWWCQKVRPEPSRAGPDRCARGPVVVTASATRPRIESPHVSLPPRGGDQLRLGTTGTAGLAN